MVSFSSKLSLQILWEHCDECNSSMCHVTLSGDPNATSAIGLTVMHLVCCIKKPLLMEAASYQPPDSIIRQEISYKFMNNVFSFNDALNFSQCLVFAAHGNLPRGKKSNVFHSNLWESYFPIRRMYANCLLCPHWVPTEKLKIRNCKVKLGKNKLNCRKVNFDCFVSHLVQLMW